MEAKKSSKADLETRKSCYLQIGLIITMFLVLGAFEWKSPVSQHISLQGTRQEFVLDETIDIIAPEPPKPKPAPITYTSFDIVDNSADVLETITIDAGIDEGGEIPVYTPVIVKELPDEKPADNTDEPFIAVETNPEFPGGEAEMHRYLAENIIYPEIAKQNNIKGTVYVRFVVERDGSISNIKVIRGIGGGCDEMSSSVIASMPKWTPGYQRLKPVRVFFTIPIEFQLRD
ncbi:MAG: energy transducer TonB [Bacteroidales bacterium]|nr:energy transducer TonB [Bacteroidales bacterium]